VKKDDPGRFAFTGPDLFGAQGDSMYRTTFGSTTYRFDTLGELMAKASPARSGDALAGIAAGSERERVAAMTALADVPLKTFLTEALIPYEQDEVTRLIMDTHDRLAFSPVSHMTVGDFRNWLLSVSVAGADLERLRPGLTPEMAAAVSKIMRNQDLILVAAKCRVITRFRTTLGGEKTMATRLQPNHPTDDERGIMASVIDGLMNGCGDACIGINPATDNLNSVMRLLAILDRARIQCRVPTQSCVLTHVTTTIEAIGKGAPVDLVFQSIGGTEAVNASFGVNLGILQEGYEAGISLGRCSRENQVMYFETGQGSALSADAHHGIDQQTVEAREIGRAHV
jgi:ethanolamine ammonia-lyase large subunit